ncbi:unnamed protein product [Prorocentrum cordatum]|uniref:Uncharacterized protein n=1 Tax=Prorocentrum cordatum TaxID=2364126 RepID=A0ABN9WZZ2_9DINO|nr:unnamed protein product [Polarella glacialis]
MRTHEACGKEPRRSVAAWAAAAMASRAAAGLLVAALAAAAAEGLGAKVGANSTRNASEAAAETAGNASSAPPAGALAAALAENDRLRAEVARLEAALHGLGEGGAGPAGSTTVADAAEPNLTGGAGGADDGEKSTHEMLVLAAALLCMALLCALPKVAPFNRCCETRLHRVCPAIALVNLIIFVGTVSQLDTISVNDVFFAAVTVAEVCIMKTQQCLVGAASIFIMLVLWKFKNRILAALGIEHAGSIVGDFRDWATCWSMWRFRPIEIYIWKVEGLPAANVHRRNDLFVETSLGYNVCMRTRVHKGAGHSCVIKESMQLNFDEFDAESRLKIAVKNQEILGSSELASVQLGAAQVHRLEEPSTGSGAVGWGATTGRTGDTLWAQSRFIQLDLVPSGRIFVRFTPVDLDGDGASCFGSCCPRRQRERRDTALLTAP